MSESSSGCGIRSIALVLIVFGLGLGYFFVKPIFDTIESRSWVPTDCEILESGIDVNYDSDGDTYAITVRYRFVARGQEFVGDRYQFMGGYSSGLASKERALTALAPGSLATCYYDPDDPYRSVVNRGLSPFLLFGLLPLVVLVIGVGMLYASLKG